MREGGIWGGDRRLQGVCSPQRAEGDAQQQAESEAQGQFRAVHRWGWHLSLGTCRDRVGLGESAHLSQGCQAHSLGLRGQGTPAKGLLLIHRTPTPRPFFPAALRSPGHHHQGKCGVQASPCPAGPQAQIWQFQGTEAQDSAKALGKALDSKGDWPPPTVPWLAGLPPETFHDKPAFLATRARALGEGFWGKQLGRRKSSPEPAPRGHTRPGEGGCWAEMGRGDLPGWG